MAFTRKCFMALFMELGVPVECKCQDTLNDPTDWDRAHQSFGKVLEASNNLRCLAHYAHRECSNLALHDALFLVADTIELHANVGRVAVKEMMKQIYADSEGASHG